MLYKVQLDVYLVVEFLLLEQIMQLLDIKLVQHKLLQLLYHLQQLHQHQLLHVKMIMVLKIQLVVLHVIQLLLLLHLVSLLLQKN